MKNTVIAMAIKIRVWRFSFDLKSITVEPVMFLYMFGNFTQFITLQALVYDKVCLLNFNETICNNLNNKTFKVEEDLVQKTTSHWLLYTNLAMGIPSLFSVVLFIGPWGDRAGRKMPIVVSLIGAIFATGSAVLNALYMSAPLSYLLIGAILNGLCGGYIAALMSMYTYIAQVSTAENKTIKIGILEAMIFLSGTLGTAISGVMLDRTSYVFVFSLLTGTMVVAVLYTLLWVDNILPEVTEDKNTEGNWCSSVMGTVKDVFLCVYHKWNDKNFLNLALMIAIIFLLMLATVGQADIILIYTRHPPLEWSQTTLGLFSGTESFLRGIGVLLILPICKKLLSTRDTTLMIMGVISKICSLVLIGLGSKTVIMFIGAVSGILQGFGSAAIRSRCSHLVNSHEQAKMFSVMSVFESVASLIATSLFNTVYNATLEFYHGFCFFMAAGLLSVGLILAGIVHRRLGRQGEQNYGVLTEETDGVNATVESQESSECT